MTDFGFQVWDKNGKPMVNLSDYSMRVVDIVRVPEGPFQDRVFTNKWCVPGKTHLVPLLYSPLPYIKSYYPGATEQSHLVPQRPFLEVRDGAFQVNALLNPQPGTMPPFVLYVCHRL